MDFENKDLGVSFTIPEPVTVRAQLAYDEHKNGLGYSKDAMMFDRLWNAARAIVKDWKCEAVKLDTDIDKVTDPKVTAVIEWVSLAVFTFMLGVSSVSKNS